MELTDLELYIQLREGKPHEHPIFADNFREAFPDVDTNSLPSDRFAKFIRVEQPQIGPYEVYEGVTYEWFDNIVKDVHHVRQMTDAEREAKTAQIVEDVNRTHLARIAFINDMLETQQDDESQKVWMDCLTAHEKWKLVSVDPITPAFPVFPMKDESGNWVVPVS